VSYVLSLDLKRLNLTQLIKESLGPEFIYRNDLRDIPMARDVSYLPEEILKEYYNAENTARVLQQLNRNNRNLPVSKLFLILEKDNYSLREI